VSAKDRQTSFTISEEKVSRNVTAIEKNDPETLCLVALLLSIGSLYRRICANCVAQLLA
jgi:hypothetical protein